MLLTWCKTRGGRVCKHVAATVRLKPRQHQCNVQWVGPHQLQCPRDRRARRRMMSPRPFADVVIFAWNGLYMKRSFGLDRVQEAANLGRGHERAWRQPASLSEHSEADAEAGRPFGCGSRDLTAVVPSTRLAIAPRQCPCVAPRTEVSASALFSVVSLRRRFSFAPGLRRPKLVLDVEGPPS